MTTSRPPGDHGSALDAIDYVLDELRDFADTFLRCWREGNLDQWPEFYVWLAEREAKRGVIPHNVDSCTVDANNGAWVREAKRGEPEETRIAVLEAAIESQSKALGFAQNARCADEAQIAALAAAVRPISWQDVRLATGEGPLNAQDVFAGCNAELRRRCGLIPAAKRSKCPTPLSECECDEGACRLGYGKASERAE